MKPKNRELNETLEVKSRPPQLCQETQDELHLNIGQLPAEMKEQLRHVLVDLLEYPSTRAAEIHRQANRMGASDIIDGEPPTQEIICDCCGLTRQRETIPICQSFSTFPAVGLSTYLLFQTTIKLVIYLAVLSLIYSAFMLYSNLTATTLNYSLLPMQISSILKYQAQDNSIQITTYLTIVVIVISISLIYFFNYSQLKEQREQDGNIISLSDFSLLIDIPHTTTQQQLQSELNRYHTLLKERFTALKPFEIKQFVRPEPIFVVEHITSNEAHMGLEKEIARLKQLFAEWVLCISEGNPSITVTNPSLRSAEYQRFQSYQSQIKQHENEGALRKQLLIQRALREGTAHCPVFVTFSSSESANIIAECNPQGFLDGLKAYFTRSRRFSFNDNSCIGLERAPQPEDILWVNFGIPLSGRIWKKLLTYSVTVILLGTSFGAVYGLNVLQNTQSNSYLSMASSLVIAVINVLISVAIRALTMYERDRTRSQQQASLAVKSTIAQLINSIVLPFLCSYYIKDNLYTKNGLCYDILYIGIANSILPPLLKIIDVGYFIGRIKGLLLLWPSAKLTLTQIELNEGYAPMVFEVGCEYVFYINVFLFTCFYVTLQPILAPIGFLACLSMHFALKYSLLQRCRRPTPGTDIVSDAMDQFIALAPIVLALGSLTWSSFLVSTYSTPNALANLIILGIAVFFYLLPYDSVMECVCMPKDEELRDYDECKAKIPMDYNHTKSLKLSNNIIETTVGFSNQGGKKERLAMSRDYLKQSTQIVVKQSSSVTMKLPQDEEDIEEIDFNIAPRKSRQTDMTEQSLFEEDEQSWGMKQRRKGESYGQGRLNGYIRKSKPKVGTLDPYN